MRNRPGVGLAGLPGSGQAGHRGDSPALGYLTAAVLVLALLSFSTAHVAAANGYRLAGIVAVGHDYLGFLELPGGGQVLVRQGSSIEGGGRVLLLDAERLRIGLPSGVIELVLDGSGRPAKVAVAAVSAAVVPVAPAAAVVDVPLPPDQDTFIVRAIDPDRLRDARVAAARTGAQGSAPSIDTARRLAPILDLPPNSTIVAVNDQPVTSADAAIARIQRSLADNVVATLNLAGSNGGPEMRVYIRRTGN